MKQTSTEEQIKNEKLGTETGAPNTRIGGIQTVFQLAI